MSELPRNWIWAKMLDLMDYEGGSQPPKKQFVYEAKPGHVRLLQIRDFGDKPYPTFVPDSKKLKKTRSEDLLLARYGGSAESDSLGRICTGLEGAYNVALAKLILPEGDLDRKYVRLLFMGPWFRNEVGKNSRSCQTGFNRGDLTDIEFPIAPLAEQRRIAYKTEALLDRVLSCQQHLERIPTLLKRFRQSVLAAACSGKLTEDWREANPNIRGSSELLHAKDVDVLPENAEIFAKSSANEIPPSWSWIPLGKLGKVRGGGTPSKENREFWIGSIPWVSPKDMKRDRICDSIDHISTTAVLSSSVIEIPRDSILFVVRGMILNHTLPVAITEEVVTINQDMKAITPACAEMSEYLFIASKSVAPKILFEVKEATHGTRRIESDVLLSWAIPVPPCDERREIVRRVKLLMDKADRIESRYMNAKAQIDKLAPAILAKAFRGELVPQDPNDESAEKLLERIRAAKEVKQGSRAASKEGKSGRPKPRKKIALTKK